MSVVAAHPALAIWGSIIVAVCLTAYALLRLTRETGQHAQARQFEASLDDWHWRPAPPAAEVHHDWYAAPTIALVPEAPPAAAPSDREWSGNSDRGETPDGPAAGGPGPDGLPEGDTQLLWPPQEAPGPGDPLTPLEKARAAMDEVKATPLSDYLDEVGAATAYGDDAPWNPFSDVTLTRIRAIKDEVA